MRNVQNGKAVGYTRLSHCTERTMVEGNNRSVHRSSRRGSQSSDIRNRFSERLLRAIDHTARCLVFAAFVVAWGGSVLSARADEEIFVTSDLNSVRVYDRLGDGNISENRILAGSNTGLRTPSGVAIDTIHGELFVVNRSQPAPSITVYDLSANGNTPPKRIISGSNTKLGTPRGLAIDTTKGKLLVTNEVSHEILIYPLGADGDVPPDHIIAGAATQLNTPWGIVVDHVHNELFVSNKDGHSITVYDLTATYNIDPGEPGNLAPLRKVTDLDPTTPLRYPKGIAVDPQNDELIVTSYGDSAIAVYPRTANGNTPPKRRLSGPDTKLHQPLGLILDLPNNELLVSNLSYPRSVVVFNRTAHGNILPLRTLTLAGSGEPVFLAVTTGPLLQVTIEGDETGSVTSDPPRIDCSTGNIGTCQATFTVDSHVTLTARTAGVSGFGGWGGDCSEAGHTTPCLVTMANPKNVTATFVAHSLTATDPSGTPNPTTSGGTASLSVSAIDSRSHPLSYAWSALCPTALGSHGTFNNPGNLTPIWTAPTNTTGVEQTCMIAVTISDGNGLSQERSYAQRVSSTTPPPPPSQPTADLILNGSTFHTGLTVNYQASIVQGSPPSSDRVDIYLGVLLPDGVTFASFVYTPSGIIAISFGSSPIPFRTDVVLIASDIVPFSYTFSGSEPVGTYVTYAALVRAGTDPLQASNRLALAVKAFDFTP